MQKFSVLVLQKFPNNIIKEQGKKRGKLMSNRLKNKSDCFVEYFLIEWESTPIASSYHKQVKRKIKEVHSKIIIGIENHHNSGAQNFNVSLKQNNNLSAARMGDSF
ncbi:hypothetical protein BpHYR1_025486 [Brachionus plicatilis]|uniref:Uncharacterized protein n=1 Tax=Brachionus plicatilis TaxID=10195 RepID=A0A3M7PB16_BRAPC|nr:hypothetical protein BpHYR1_025486 [Brachionus plicatilis]